MNRKAVVSFAASILFSIACALANGADVPKELRPPEGHDKVLHHAKAKGFQIYVCTKDAAGNFSWQVKPDAELFDEKGEKEGTHFEGPSWKLNDGSKIVADKLKEVPHEGACALLLLKVKSSEGTGALSKVEYVQRLNTTGGAKPAEAPTAANEKKEVKVEYTADYYFLGAP